MATPFFGPHLPTPKEYVHSLYKQNNKNTLAAQSIDKDIGAFCPHGFINELLQNADDLVRKDLAEVSFTLINITEEAETYTNLIFSHNGKLFDQEDVRRICDYANANHNLKGADSEKTGFKDVGFKSVFSTASKVDVLSGEWRFCFNENDPNWKREPEGNLVPWQIAPLWIEEEDLTEGEKRDLKDNKTSFICYLRNAKDTCDTLSDFINCPERLLFLKRISSLAITINGQTHLMTCKNEVCSINGITKSRWKRIDETVYFTPEVLMDVQGLKLSVCPKRLKGKKEITVSFCYQKKGNEFVAAQDSCLYNTLSTEVDAGLPFMVDAPFSLDPTREKLNVDPLNKFLIPQIAQLNFFYIRKCLAQNPSAIRVLAFSDIGGVYTKLKNKFKECMDNLIKDEPLLPPQSGNALLRVSESKIDRIGFLRMLQENNIIFPLPSFISPLLDPDDVLKRFPEIPKTDLNWAIQLLPALMKRHRNIDTCQKLLTYFIQTFPDDRLHKELRLLKTQAFIFNTEMELCSLEHLYLPLEGKTRKLPSHLLVNVIHPSLLNVNLINWLHEIEIENLTPEIIVEIYSDRLTDSSLEDKIKNIEVIQLFYDFYKEKLLNRQDIARLKGIFLFNQRSKPKTSHELYFPSFYQPQYPLEDRVEDLKEIFLSTSYPPTRNELDQWKTFFIALGVYEQPILQEKGETTVGKMRQIPFAFFQKYLNDVFRPNNPSRPAALTGKRLAENHDDISPFLYFPFIQKIPESPLLEKYFWDQLVKKQAIVLKGKNEKYHAFKAKSKENTLFQPYTYLQFLFRTESLVCNTTGQHRKAPELYAPSMQSVIGNRFPTAKLSVKLSPELEEFIGFKTFLDCKACEFFLNSLQASYKQDSYKFVMKQILLNLRKKDQETLSAIKRWKFQAANGEWRLVSQLHLWAVPHIPTPRSNDWFKPIFSDDREMEEFCSYLGIEPQKDHHDPELIKNAVLCDDLKDFILGQVPYIAFYWARECNFDRTPLEFISAIRSKINSLNFYLRPEIDDEEMPIVTLSDQNFVYYPDWKSHKDRLGEPLAKHFGFESQSERNSLIIALNRTRPFRGEEQKQFQEYQKAFEEWADTPFVPSSPQTEPPIAQKPPSDGSDSTPLSKTAPKEEPQQHQTPNKEEKSWTPKTSPLDINPTNVSRVLFPSVGWKPTRRASENFKKSPKKNLNNEEKSGLSEIDKKRIGLWAEERVVTLLVDRYNKKLSNAAEDRTHAGVIKIASKIKKISYELWWNNDPQLRPAVQKDNELWDSGKPYDIKVIEKNEERVIRKEKFEVKGTTGSKVHFYFSAREWQACVRDPQNYRVCVITDAGTEDADLVEINDFMAYLRERRITPISTTEFTGGAGQQMETLETLVSEIQLKGQ